MPRNEADIRQSCMRSNWQQDGNDDHSCMTTAVQWEQLCDRKVRQPRAAPCRRRGSASAMASVEVPVNMPTSSTLFAPVSRTSDFRKLPSSPPAQQFAVCRNRVFFCASVCVASAPDRSC